MEFDVLSIHEKSATVHLEAGAVKSLRNTEIRRFGTRRFENGRLFQASRVGEADEARLLADTREWGGPGVPHDHGFAPAHREARSGPEVGIGSLADFEDCATELASRHPEFVFSGKCSATSVSTALRSSYGLDLKSSGGICDWYVLYQRKGSGNMIDGYVAESSARPAFRREIGAHSEYLAAQKRQAKLEAGRIPVLFVEAMTPIEKLGESLAVNRYREGSCLYAGKLGEPLFSPQVTLLDRAYVPEAGIHSFFDGEGVVRAQDDLVVIDRGRFSRLISDLRFGKKFNEPSTGNGLRSFNSGVGLSTRTLAFAPGAKPWRELVRGLDRCLLALVAGGGDTNDLGEFSTPVQIGYVFEKGELVGLAPQVTVKASITDYLGRNLIAVASDAFTPSATSASVISEMDVLLN